MKRMSTEEFEPIQKMIDKSNAELEKKIEDRVSRFEEYKDQVLERMYMVTADETEDFAEMPIPEDNTETMQHYEIVNAEPQELPDKYLYGHGLFKKFQTMFSTQTGGDKK